MKNPGRQFWWTLAAGILLVFAGFRDWLAPGFLSMAGRYHSSRFDIAFLLVSGLVFIIIAIQKATRRHA